VAFISRFIFFSPLESQFFCTSPLTPLPPFSAPPQEIRKKIDQKEITIELFDDGQKEIFNLMSRDSYQRFLNARASRKTTRRGSSNGSGGRRKSISNALGIG
jgi:hypothetical protein